MCIFFDGWAVVMPRRIGGSVTVMQGLIKKVSWISLIFVGDVTNHVWWSNHVTSCHLRISIHVFLAWSIPVICYSSVFKKAIQKSSSSSSPFRVDFAMKLVGGLEHCLFSHILGSSSSQLTNSYFSDG